MSQSDPAAPGQQQDFSIATAELQTEQSLRAYNSLVEKITPWLFEVGSWIFGGLIAFTVLILAALIPIRPVDLPIEIALTAFALALPLHVTGLVLLRLVRDVKPVGFEEQIAQSLQNAGLTPGEQQVPSLTALATLRTRGTRNVLNTSLGILAVSSALTVVGVAAALWHIIWWIAVAFCVMVVLCQALAQIVLFTAQPPLTAEQKAQRRRQHDAAVKQARELAREQTRLAKQRSQQAKQARKQK